MNAADRFACLPSLLDGDHDLKRRGRWVNVECRVDIGDEPLFLAITAAVHESGYGTFETSRPLRRQHRAMSEFEGEADLNVTSADFG